MSPTIWIPEGGQADPAFEAAVRREAHRISDEQIAKLGIRKSWGRVIFEEGARGIAFVGAVLGTIFYVAKPHFDQYLESKLAAHRYAVQGDLDDAVQDITEVRKMAEASKDTLIAMTTKVDEISEATRESNRDIKVILQRLPRQLGQTPQQ